jgi:hypothetical protein
LFLWSALSDERTGLSFVYAASPCERSLSRVRVHWDPLPYFTLSDLRFPFSSPPTTRRVTPLSRAKKSSSILPATSQHGQSWHRAPLAHMAIYLFNIKTFVFFFFPSFVVPPLIKRDGLDIFYNWCSLTTPYSLHSAGLGFSLYNLQADQTENTATNVFLVLTGGCLAISRISFPRERVYRALA